MRFLESTSEAWKSATLLSEEIPIEVQNLLSPLFLVQKKLIFVVQVVFEDDHVIVINKAKGMAVC